VTSQCADHVWNSDCSHPRYEARQSHDLTIVQRRQIQLAGDNDGKRYFLEGNELHCQNSVAADVTCKDDDTST